MVCVISKTGKKLMPTTERRCRKLLKQGRAKIVSSSPFTIQLVDNQHEYTQPVTLSLDMGSQNIGYAVIVHGEKREKVAFNGEVEQRAYVNAESRSPVLQARACYRRSRRGRLWYRQARFNNRKRGECGCKVCGKNTQQGKALCKCCAKKGHKKFKGIHKRAIWLAPTLRAKADLHCRIVHVWNKYLPIADVVIETVSFDLQKMVKADISGKEYQQGEQLGFENVRMFVRYRDQYTCRMCEKKSQSLEVHHIEPRKRNGASNPGNLITLCHTCHKKITGSEEKYCDQFRAAIGSVKRKLAKTSQVNSFKEYILTHVPLPHEETFGYITKHKRKKLGLPKSHATDAIAIGVKELEKPLFVNCEVKKCKSQRRAVRQQFKANPLKGKGFVRYRQPFNQIAGIGRGDVCWHSKKKCQLVIDTLLKTCKFNGTEVTTGRRIGSVTPQYLKLLQKKRSLQF